MPTMVPPTHLPATLMFAVCEQDSSFGPGSSCRSLDFTVDFEQTILSFSPDIIFLLLTCCRLIYLKGQPRQPPTAKGKTLLALKFTISLLVIACDTGSFIYGRHHHLPSAFIWLAAPILQIICAVFLSLLMVVEHFHAVTSSTLIISYTFIRGLFTAVALRSANQMGLRGSAIAISALVTSSYFLFFCVELIPKPHSKTPSNILSRFLYIWLIPLLWKGRKIVLTIDDCGTLPEEFGAKSTRQRLDRLILGRPNRKPLHLISASLRAFPLTFISPVFPRILLLIASFAQPLLVSRMITYISDPGPGSAGGALVGAFACVYGLIALTTSIYWEKVYDCSVCYRGALVGSIYTKTLRLSSHAGRELGGGVASTYMSVDVERISDGLQVFHETWAALASIILAILILYSQTTWPSFLPLAIIFVLFSIAGYISQGVGAAQKQWLGSTDRRVKYLTSVLHNYLPMKWAHYEDIVSGRAQELRSEEMRGAQSFYNNICITGALTTSAALACNLSVLGPYAALAAHGHQPLDPNRMFTILATLNLMTGPLELIGESLPQLLAAYASLKRIEEYLSRQDKDLAPNEDTKEKSHSEEHILFDAASFSWAPGSPPFIGPLSLQLAQGQLHIIVGPVAAGKSMFVLSLLGETTCTQGALFVPDVSIAYAAQEPLIIAASVRENILFGHEYSAMWYDRVLEACDLTLEIERMEGRDGMLITEKGSNLSGGQRQRISLARAIYSKATWTLLDDTFSALDAQTADHVFRSLFGARGLLKDRGVVLITHDLTHLPKADNILVFESGAIPYQGSLAQIKAAGYNVERYITKTDDKETLIPDPKESKKESGDLGKIQVSEEKAIQDASVGLVPYIFYASLAGWMNSVAVVTLLSLTGCVALAANIYLQQWSTKSGDNAGHWVGGYAGLVFANFVFIAFGMWVFAIVITGRVGQNIHAIELSGLLKTAPEYVMQTAAGLIINRFSQDIFMCDLEFPIALLNVILSAVAIVGSIVFILIPVPWLTLAVPFAAGFYWMMMSFYLKTSKQFQQLTAESKSPLYTLFHSTISGLVTIRAMRVDNYFQNINDELLSRSQIPFYLRLAGRRFLQTFLSLISFVLATTLAGLVVGLRNSVSASTLGLALSTLTNISGQLSSLVMGLAGLENASVAISRIHEIAMLPEETDPAVAQSASKNPVDMREAASLTFQDVHMRYSPGLPDAIRKVSFHISAGQKVGVCGRSGSGKSSLILAIFRGLNQSLMAGQILVNGVDTQTIPLETLRESLSLVAQSPVIWYASVRENLDPQNVRTDQDIWATLNQVGIKSVILDLPHKLETMLEAEGSLSSGQRQLLCIARVLLRNRKFVILDEASSSLDQETDKKIGEIIRSELADCTVIAIAHRIDTIIDFDLILVMEDGMLVETGPPMQLLSRSDSRFSRLAAGQGLKAAGTGDTQHLESAEI